MAMPSAPDGSSAAIPVSRPVRAPRLFDLVLFSPGADDDMRKLRLMEIAGHVDQIIFAHTTFLFRDGSQRLWNRTGPVSTKNMSSHITDYAIVGDRELQGCDILELEKGNRRQRAASVFFKTKAAFCRESFARNALGRAFVEAGGTPDDWALISDADEIPSAAALQELRKQLPSLGRAAIALSLGACLATHVAALSALAPARPSG